MEYNYENLGPERFQEFCQALLMESFPELLCLPVAQPDGGRDAIYYSHGEKAYDFVVFQVKFVRHPKNDDGKEVDPHVWLTGVLDGEAEKVDKLIPKGAKQYYLLTNVRGTSHLDNGSIDKVQNILKEKIKIPAVCWWRGDIDRRLEGKSNLKWSFPELLGAHDILRHLVESDMTESRDRRHLTIRAFLKDQYDIESEVKFKQVELQNNLFDLFIDVPVEVLDPSQTRSSAWKRVSQGSGKNVSRNFRLASPFDSLAYSSGAKRSVGASDFLLHPQVALMHPH